MTGFLTLALIGVAAFGAAILLGVPRVMWSFIGAALFLGAAGYAWQGRPGLRSHDVKADADPIPVEPEMVAFRERLMGRFTADTAYITASDAMLRAGDSGAATQVILGGIRAIPKSFILWTQLGTNLAIHDGGQVSPTAIFAFQQAMRLAPMHPAPPYYLGLAYLRSGDLPAALPFWRRAAALSAPGSDYRREIEEQIMLLQRFVAMANAQGGR